MELTSLGWRLRARPHAALSTETVLLIAVCAAAAALRFATLGVRSFDFDESYTVGEGAERDRRRAVRWSSPWETRH